MSAKISNLKVADYNLVDDNSEMAYFSTYSKSEHEMFGEHELESEGGGGE